MKERRNLKALFISVASKTLFLAALVFSMSPCGGKIYEPVLPEELFK